MTTLSSRVRTVSSAGTLAILLLVLVFGNEAFVEWVHRHHSRQTAGDYLLNVLTYPNWEFFPDDQTDQSWREWFAQDLRAILVILLVAALLAVGSHSLLSRGTAGFGGFIAAGLLIGIDNGSWLLRALQIAAVGAAYGLFFGWIVAAVASGARRG